LSDSQAHSEKAMSKAAGYASPKSVGFWAIMEALKYCKLIVNEGASRWKFVVEKVFPYAE
jgi:hypothetical protein